jgi:hypothetical protein
MVIGDGKIAMNILNKNSGSVSIREISFLIMVSIFFILIMIYDDSSLRPNLELKTCIANMERIHHAARLVIMEDPTIEEITLQELLKRGYLKHIPKCPSFKDGKYVISADPGKPVDVLCIHGNNEIGHGSYLSLKAKYIDKK